MKVNIGSDRCDCCDGPLGDKFQLVTNAVCMKCVNYTKSETVTVRQVAAMIVDMTESLKEKSTSIFVRLVRASAIAELTEHKNKER